MNPSLEPGQPGEPLEGGDVVLGVVERRTTLVRLPLLRHLEEGRFLSCKDTNRCIYFLSLKLFCHPNTPGQRLRELNFSPVSFDHLGYILFHESQGCVGGGGGIHHGISLSDIQRSALLAKQGQEHISPNFTKPRTKTLADLRMRHSL